MALMRICRCRIAARMFLTCIQMSVCTLKNQLVKKGPDVDVTCRLYSDHGYDSLNNFSDTRTLMLHIIDVFGHVI